MYGCFKVTIGISNRSIFVDISTLEMHIIQNNVEKGFNTTVTKQGKDFFDFSVKQNFNVAIGVELKREGLPYGIEVL